MRKSPGGVFYAAGFFMEKLIPWIKEQNALKIIPDSLHSAETKN